MELATLLGGLIWLAIGAAAFFLVLFLVRASDVFVYIGSDEYGVVERRVGLRRSSRGGFIATDGAAGYQPDLLRTGPHLFFPWLYRVHKQKLITVRGMAYVFARDGAPLPAGQTLARTPEHVDFENARHFLASGGQRGPQRRILREGVYAINTAMFIVIADDKTYALDIGADKDALNALRQTIEARQGFSPVVIEQDLVGLVTVHDGPALEEGDLIAPVVGNDPTDEVRFHNSFQDPQSFIDAGGRRGRQEHVLVEGTYFVNRLFATVEVTDKLVIAPGRVGVVVSYIGQPGENLRPDSRHGQLVERGRRGIWATPLGTGKYPINPYAMQVSQVPVTNFVLRWSKNRAEEHGFDDNLAEIPMITADAFEVVLPLSVVVHISPDSAPGIIQQFADIKLLVEQTIDPLVSAFFKDSAQKHSLLDLIGKRAELQAAALEAMRPRFAQYHLDLLEVMVGTPRPAPGDNRVEQVLDQLRSRQLAAEQQITYASQQAAAETERELNRARADAAMQTQLSQARMQADIAEQEGQAALARKRKEAEAVQAMGEAEAQRIRAVGLAQAEATRAQVEAYTGEGARFQFSRDVAQQLAEAITHATVPVVPSISLGGGKGEHGASMVDALLGVLVSNGFANGAMSAPREKAIN